MGAQQSAMQSCVLSALGNDSSLVATPSNLLYHAHDVHPYNLDLSDIQPVAIAYPETADQVSALIKCAAEANLPVQARGGGHSFGNHCIGGQSGSFIIDVKNFNQISLDPDTNQLSVGAGLRLGDITKALENTGRAMAVGNVPDIGVAGHVAIGGLGSASRMWGTVSDQVDEIEVVLADGSIVTASSTENQDIFWAFRGAGQHFGIATNFKFHTQPTPSEFTTFRFGYGGLQVETIQNAYKSWHAFVSNPDLDRKFACDVIHTPIGMIIVGTYFGPRADFDKIDFSGLWPGYNKTITAFDDIVGWAGHEAENAALVIAGKLPAHFYMKSVAINDWMSNSTIDKMIEQIYSADHGTIAWVVLTDLEGGAVNDPSIDASAFAQRNAKFYVQGYAIGATGVSDTSKQWLSGLISLLQEEMPDSTKGTYPGYIDPELDNAVQVYWGDNLPKLQQLKQQYDPNSVFWNPQPIEPSS